MRPSPLDDARLLLALVRLLYRVRRRACRAGLPAGPALEATETLGQALAAAVEAAEQATSDRERQLALLEVARLGEALTKTLQARRDGAPAMLRVLIAGVRGGR